MTANGDSGEEMGIVIQLNDLDPKRLKFGPCRTKDTSNIIDMKYELDDGRLVDLVVQMQDTPLQFPPRPKKFIDTDTSVSLSASFAIRSAEHQNKLLLIDRIIKQHVMGGPVYERACCFTDDGICDKIPTHGPEGVATGCFCKEHADQFLANALEHNPNKKVVVVEYPFTDPVYIEGNGGSVVTKVFHTADNIRDALKTYKPLLQLGEWKTLYDNPKFKGKKHSAKDKLHTVEDGRHGWSIQSSVPLEDKANPRSPTKDVVFTRPYVEGVGYVPIDYLKDIKDKDLFLNAHSLHKFYLRGFVKDKSWGPTSYLLHCSVFDKVQYKFALLPDNLIGNKAIFNAENRHLLNDVKINSKPPPPQIKNPLKRGREVVDDDSSDILAAAEDEQQPMIKRAKVEDASILDDYNDYVNASSGGAEAAVKEAVVVAEASLNH